MLLYGTLRGNSVLQSINGQLPVSASAPQGPWPQALAVADDWRMIFCAPSPYNSRHYVLVYTALADSVLVGINLVESENFLRHDTTDYVLAAGDSVLSVGFFDKSDPEAWKIASP